MQIESFRAATLWVISVDFRLGGGEFGAARPRAIDIHRLVHGSKNYPWHLLIPPSPAFSP
jgi:hypothetical protein